MARRRLSVPLRTIIGMLAIALFVAIYAVELLPHHGPPVTLHWVRNTLGQGGLIALNIVIVLAFLALLPYRRPTRNVWQSRGAFVAFVIALMTEMFGWPLVLFLVSPLVEVPIIADRWFQAVGHGLASVGTAVSFSGIILIALGWRQIHRAQTLVSSGVYRYIRHPQYSGMFLFTFGWILHWPSLITLLIWPVLIAAYVWLARQEERHVREEFGEIYMDYAQRTKRFIPFVI